MKHYEGLAITGIESVHLQLWKSVAGWGRRQKIGAKQVKDLRGPHVRRILSLHIEVPGLRKEQYCRECPIINTWSIPSVHVPITDSILLTQQKHQVFSPHLCVFLPVSVLENVAKGTLTSH